MKQDIRIDHCTLAKCKDGLVDVVNGSTAITVSNNHMLQHNEVMLMGRRDDFDEHKNMQVTIAYSYFGEGLVQRIPRHRYFHIVNNIYTGWGMYGIGGSANPTINSQGNVFIALDDSSKKEITKRGTKEGDTEWKEWNWRSDGDLLLNGARFTGSGKLEIGVACENEYEGKWRNCIERHGNSDFFDSAMVNHGGGQSFRRVGVKIFGRIPNMTRFWWRI
ncbi:putative pectate lyase 21 [Primulina eburnea]|uniref:putative pectate lyase 21 n=1 Tax=Primulina eburnea TaxID=1245227 RepID=UPI003C6C4165